MADEKTNIQEVEFDNLEDLLGVGSESIMVPAGSTTVDDNKKPGIFSQTTTDTTFLDKPIVTDPVASTKTSIEDTPAGTPPATPPAEDLSLETLNELLDTSIEEAAKNLIEKINRIDKNGSQSKSFSAASLMQGFKGNSMIPYLNNPKDKSITKVIWDPEAGTPRFIEMQIGIIGAIRIQPFLQNERLPIRLCDQTISGNLP